MTADPRAALTKLIATFERHLEASSGRNGEDDPRVVAALRDRLPEGIPRGIVAESSQDDPAYAALPESERRSLAHLLHVSQTQPDFLSWRVDDLPNAATHLARHYGGLPVMAWTVRTPDQRARAEAHADQMVFEGFVP